jgi:hypothetical protein
LLCYIDIRIVKNKSACTLWGDQDCVGLYLCHVIGIGFTKNQLLNTIKEMKSGITMEQLLLGGIVPGSQRQAGNEHSDELKKNHATAWQWISLGLCLAVLEARMLVHPVRIGPERAHLFPSEWFLPAAAVLAVLGIIVLSERPRWHNIHLSLHWVALVTVLWIANRLPFDVLTIAGLLGDPSTGQAAAADWPGIATRVLALAATIALARITLTRPAKYEIKRPTAWYGYAAFVLALPYPVIRLIWAFGGTLGLMHPGDGGTGFSPLLFALPWALAAVLSLFLASPPRWMPRRLLLTAGWTATVIVASVGPLAVWTLLTQIFSHSINCPPGMSFWVPCLFYGSWFLWAIAGCAATRAYQLSSAPEFTKSNQ